MNDRPVFNLRFNSKNPGADPDAWERYNKWVTEVYIPLIYMKFPGVRGVDRYQIIRENPEYPKSASITHFETLNSWQNFNENTANSDVQNDLVNWGRRGVVESIWSAAYELIKGFRSEPPAEGKKADTRIEKASVMHLEAYRLPAGDNERYYTWFSEYGCKMFVPLLIRLPGLKGYDWLKFTGLMLTKEVREQEYPLYLSVIYFDTMPSFESYTRSPEQNAFQIALRTVFPRGLKYEWYVQYELKQSWRK